MAAWRLTVRDWLGALLACGACAAPPSAGSLPRAGATVEAATAEVASPEGDAPRDAGEAPVGSKDAVEELLDMVAVLADGEAHVDALRAIDASPYALDLGVAMARADLLRDMGRRHEALAVMRGVRESLGAAAIAPQVLFEFAELERLEGDRAAARRTLASIRELHGEAAWTRANDSRLALVDGQLAAGEPVRAMAARDLLGNLRGAPQPAERLAALRALLDGAYGDADRALAVRERAITIALGDDSEPVRLAGVEAWTYDAAIGRDFVALALCDASPRVRRAAVVHAANLPTAAASALLLARMSQEADVEVFLALHDGLRAAAGGGAAITPLDAATAAGRAAVVDRWRRGGLGKEAR